MLMSFKLSKGWIITGFAIITIIILIIVSGRGSGNYDDFAKCVTDSGAVFYGSYQCTHCSSQKQMFGKSMQYVNYVECGPLSGPQAQECVAAGIRAYPSWMLGSGQLVEGLVSLEQLSQL